MIYYLCGSYMVLMWILTSKEYKVFFFNDIHHIKCFLILNARQYLSTRCKFAIASPFIFSQFLSSVIYFGLSSNCFQTIFLSQNHGLNWNHIDLFNFKLHFHFVCICISLSELRRVSN